MAELNTRVILSKGIKLDRELKNVLNYTETEMLNLLTSQTHIVAQTNKASFINPTGVIKVPFTYSQCLQSNYIAFQNPNYSNKWFFAFIDNVTFRSKNMQEIRYTVDSWSTWFSKLTIKPCFVVREHVNDDTIGLHTLDENIGVGEVVCMNEYKEMDNDTFYIAIMTTYDPIVYDNNNRSGKDFSTISLYNSNFFGNMVFLFPVNLTDTGTITASVERLIWFLYYTQQDKTGDLSCISNMFLIPDELITNDNLIARTFSPADDPQVQYVCYQLKHSAGADKKDVFIPTGTYTPTGFYSPVNNKCYCYPFNYLYVTNNCGNDNIYKYEDFIKIEQAQVENCCFEIDGAVSIGYSAKLVPYKYKGVDYNTSESVPLGKFPTCGWASDAYINWLTQQSVNYAGNLKNLGSSALSLGSSVAHNNYEIGRLNDLAQSDNVSSAMAETYQARAGSISNSNNLLVASAVGGALSSGIGQAFEAHVVDKMLPNVSYGSNLGDVNLANNDLNFTFRQMRCKDEYMRQIDTFFSCFGYKINELKMPNITGRANFNHIQIGDHECIGYGSVPSPDLDIINKACRRGVTIWHNHTNLGDYSVTNNII